ncbi:MAG: stage sporulation protein [Eubacteriales bacterium]|nr:stage sporulation protein [Eubacteriales bacterium]
MKTFVVRKQYFWLVVLMLFGLTLFFLGARENKRTIDAVEVLKGKPLVKVDEEAAKENLVSKKDEGLKQDFFIDYRLERDRNRDRQLDLLREIINNSNTSQEARQKAQERVMLISQRMEKEMEIENLLRARGYRDAVAVIQDDGVTVVVKTAVLKPGEQEQIQDLVIKVTGGDKAKVTVLARE